MSLGLAKRTWKDYPQNQLWGQVHKSYFKTITQRRNLAKKKFLISWDSKNKHNIWPTKSIQLFLNRKFRFIKENFGAPLNSVSLWNLMWILHPLQKFQGQRNIRKLPLKWFKAFRRVSFLSQVPPRSMEERLRDEHPIHKMIPSGKAKICCRINHQANSALLMVSAGSFWKISPADFTFFLPTPFRWADEGVINLGKARAAVFKCSKHKSFKGLANCLRKLLEKPPRVKPYILPWH